MPQQPNTVYSRRRGIPADQQPEEAFQPPTGAVRKRPTLGAAPPTAPLPPQPPALIAPFLPMAPPTGEELTIPQQQPEGAYGPEGAPDILSLIRMLTNARSY